MGKIVVVLLVLAFCAVNGFGDFLTVVNVSAPNMNCIFSPICKVTVSDTSAPIVIPGTSGSGFLQSRTYRGVKGSQVWGLHVYEYQVDLRNVVGSLNIPSITSMSLDFGPVGWFEYNGDGKKGVRAFVVTSGGLGSVGLSSASKVGNTVTFNFAGGGVAAGGSPGHGQSSYFFGLVSKNTITEVTATLTLNTGGTISVKARSAAL
ncbi:MAG TPA: hypothetical protein VFV34_21030 [Blastocatellia bacterium]|nr:hypothetical protein [Blastocatellia bacterium]